MTFGDWEPDDSYDREPADPEQVARILHALRRDRGLESIDWDALGEPGRVVLVAVIAALWDRLRREGSVL